MHIYLRESENIIYLIRLQSKSLLVRKLFHLSNEKSYSKCIHVLLENAPRLLHGTDHCILLNCVS